MSSMRITGMMSGMDTDKMIKDLMKAESTRIDKVKQDRQFMVWQQEAYRDIINKTRALQSKYLDVLNPSQNMRSTTSFSKFNFSVLSGGVESGAVSVSGASASGAKQMRIDEIRQLASKDTFQGNASGLRTITSKEIEDFGAFKAQLAGKNFEMTLAVGEQSRLIRIDASVIDGLTTLEDFHSELSAAVSSAFGSDYAGAVSIEGNKISIGMPGQTMKVLTYAGNSQSMSAMGFKTGQSTDDYRTKNVGQLFGFTESKELTINGKSVTINRTDTIAQMMSKINNSDMGVEMTYSSISDQFTLTSSKEGSANNMQITDPGTLDFLTTVFKADFSANENRTSGKNALLTVDGIDIVQSSNRFTLDGMTMNLTSTHGVDEDGLSIEVPPILIAATVNVDGVMDNIKSFIEEYNALITSITDQRSERRNYDFKPLTDEERESLSEREIELWEERAKSGVLRGATELDTFVMRMRNVMIDSIEGVGISMSQIGIKSGSYMDRGALTIDEDKLRSSLENNFEEVVGLFTQTSTIRYTDSARSAERYQNNGIANRLDDVIRDFTRTTRDSAGRKGILLERAGIENDTTFSENFISRRLKSFDDRIMTLERFLEGRETYYYQMFSRMESALSQMDAQAGSLMNMFGGN